MHKKLNLFVAIVVMSLFLMPSMSKAAWWNPGDWFKSNQVCPTPEVQDTKTIDSLKKQIEDLQSQVADLKSQLAKATNNKILVQTPVKSSTQNSKITPFIAIRENDNNYSEKYVLTQGTVSQILSGSDTSLVSIEDKDHKDKGPVAFEINTSLLKAKQIKLGSEIQVSGTYKLNISKEASDIKVKYKMVIFLPVIVNASVSVL